MESLVNQEETVLMVNWDYLVLLEKGEYLELLECLVEMGILVPQGDLVMPGPTVNLAKMGMLVMLACLVVMENLVELG